MPPTPDPDHRLMVLAAHIFEAWGARGLITDEVWEEGADPEWEKAKVAAQTALIDGEADG